MNTPAKTLHRRLVLAGLTAAPFVLPLSLNAQSWDGGGSPNFSWNLNTNWSPDTVPTWANTTALTFDVASSTHSYLGGAIPTVKSISYGSLVDTLFETTLRADLVGGTARSLTFSADTGNASLTVAAGAAGNITIGVGTGAPAGGGNIVLTSHLAITHNGTGELLFNRHLSGNGGFTKTGSGTLRLAPTVATSFGGELNLNAGRVIFASTASGAGSATSDFGSATAINLGGGTMEVRTTTALNKTLSPNMTVSSASTLAYNNAAATDQSLTVSTGSLALNAGLTIENISTSTAGNNLVNVSRNLTGTGALTIKTYNPVATVGANFSQGRVQLSGNNSAWSGDLVVAQGTAQISGANATGTGDIILGETASASGVGLALNTSVDVNYGNDIIVRTGGLRAIKNNTGTSGNTTFSGSVTLEGDLTIDHNLLNSGQSLSFSGNITGAGGVTITRSVANNGSAVFISGANTYLGDTNVVSGTLVFNGSGTTDINVDATSRFGGSGSTSGSLSLADGAKFIFNPLSSFTVSGAVSLPSSFGVASLVNADGTAIDWASISSSTFTLLNNSTNFSGIGNFGVGNAFDLGDGRHAWFQNGSLQLVVGVIPEPSSFALVGGLGALAFCATRRRRAAA